MKQTKKILAIMLTLVLSISMIPTINVSAAKKVKLNKTKVTIYVGKTVTLKLKNNKKKIKWSSSNKKVATVTSKGKVKGKKVGKATITAKVGKKKYKCKVTVKKKVVKQTTPQTIPQPIEKTTTKPSEQSTTSKQEETTNNQEQPTTNITEEPTTNSDDYGDSGEDWIVKSTSNKCWIQGYVGTETDIVIPEKICGKTVVGIDNGAFAYCDSLISVIIPNSVTSIGDSAFSHCTNLKRVEIPNSVTKIEGDAFSSCRSLKELIIPNSVVYMGMHTFSFNDMETVKLPYVQNYEFFVQSCTINQVIYYEGTSKINLGDFSFCSIESVIIPESVIEIEMEISDYYKSKINNIVGKQGSYAELWAKQNGYTFIAQ